MIFMALLAAIVMLGASCAAGQGAKQPANTGQAHSSQGRADSTDHPKAGTGKKEAAASGSPSGSPSKKTGEASRVAKQPPATPPTKPGGKQVAGSGGGIARAPVCPPPGQALAGVYHPERLKVLYFCTKASGTVVEIRNEEDGDLHINIAPDPAYKDLLIPGNYSGENGDLVVEMMARDGGHLPEPESGQHLDLVGAYVNDLQHDWAEIHPVWSVSINSGPPATSGPRYGGSPDEARSYNAEGECRTQAGTVCRGYGSGSYSEEASGQGKPKGGGEQSASANKDYNCSDFATQAEAQKYLLPGDPYRLDANHDGRACDSLP